MRAEITSKGMLKLTPISLTEETMLNIWAADKEQNSRKVKSALIIDVYEETGPTCIREIAETAGDVSKLSSEMRKELRKNTKAELDKMGVEYNGRAATNVLQGVLEKAKAAANADPNAKKPTGKTSPEKPEEPAEPAAKPEKKEPPAEAIPLTLDAMKIVVKRFYAVHGALKAKQLILGCSATKVSEIKEADYPALVEAMKVSEEEYQEAVEAARKKKEAADGK